MEISRQCLLSPGVRDGLTVTAQSSQGHPNFLGAGTQHQHHGFLSCFPGVPGYYLLPGVGSKNDCVNATAGRRTRRAHSSSLTEDGNQLFPKAACVSWDALSSLSYPISSPLCLLQDTPLFSLYALLSHPRACTVCFLFRWPILFFKAHPTPDATAQFTGHWRVTSWRTLVLKSQEPCQHLSWCMPSDLQIPIPARMRMG